MRFLLGLGVVFLLASFSARALTVGNFDNLSMDKAAGTGATVEGSSTAAPASLASSSATPRELAILAEAYADARALLEGDDECSNFFGGTEKATQVFDQLAAQLEIESNENPSLGILMGGGYSNIQDMKSGASFRLFSKARINRKGPFFQKMGPSNDFERKSISPFERTASITGSREARALMLLHELGHLIRGADGKWLLPNDGYDRTLSIRNTNLVEEKCGDKLKTIRMRSGLVARDQSRSAPMTR